MSCPCMGEPDPGVCKGPCSHPAPGGHCRCAPNCDQHVDVERPAASEKPMVNPLGGGRWYGEDQKHLSVRLAHARAEVDAVIAQLPQDRVLSLGVINGSTLTRHWRYATVIIAIIAAAGTIAGFLASRPSWV